MDRNRFARLVLYLYYCTYGLSVTLIAPLVADMSADFGLTDTQAGLINTLNFIGGFAAICSLVFLTRKFRKGWIFVIASLLFIAMMFIMGAANGFTMLLLLMILLGCGMKIVDAMGNSIIADRFGEKASSYTSTLHMSFSIGAFLAPIIIGTLKNSAGFGWRQSYLLFGVIIAAFFVLFICGWRDMGRADTAAVMKPGDSKRDFLWSREFWIVCAMLFLYCFHQMGVTYWTATFFASADVPQIIADFSSSVLWIGIIVARFVASRVNPRLALPWAVWGSLLGGALIIAAVAAYNPYLMLVAYFAAGFGAGAMLPMLIARMNMKYPEYSGLVTTLMSMSFVLGSALSTVVMGGIADSVGMQTAMLLGGGLPLVIIFALGLLQFKGESLFTRKKD